MFLVIFLVGNLFNMGINIIGTYVHAARLQYLEFFSKFYKEGGVPFNPLKYQTKYVDVTTDSGEAVSYTHLDVYKRQVYHSGMLSESLPAYCSPG